MPEEPRRHVQFRNGAFADQFKTMKPGHNLVPSIPVAEKTMQGVISEIVHHWELSWYGESSAARGVANH
jgi:hypothetical protein